MQAVHIVILPGLLGLLEFVELHEAQGLRQRSHTPKYAILGAEQVMVQVLLDRIKK